jgi:uncharacterized protein (DUF3820 family)
MEKVDSKRIDNFRFKFGKHKGKKFNEVEVSYLQWCLEEGVFSDDKYKWNASIRDYITAKSTQH